VEYSNYGPPPKLSVPRLTLYQLNMPAIKHVALFAFSTVAIVLNRSN
jgi:hypothetical protein